MKTLIIAPDPDQALASQYVKDLLDAFQPTEPGVTQATIRHDDWCVLLARKGPCNCNPDIELERVRS